MDNIQPLWKTAGLNSDPMDWACKACDTIMAKYTPDQLPIANNWNYHCGVFLHSADRVWRKTNKNSYFDYIKAWADNLIDKSGNLRFLRDELDSIQAGLLLFTLDENTNDKRYKIAADRFRNMFLYWNKTSQGGFWHKDRYPYQMWLDGLYMAGPFAVRYANSYDDSNLYDQAAFQAILMMDNTRDEKTGLYFHGWDESRIMPWSDDKTGCSPEFWGRSLGWLGISLVDVLEYLPEDHCRRQELIVHLNNFLVSLVKYQDSKTGLWFQVVDKGDRADNWVETSCTSLFVYTLAKAVSKGYVGKEFSKAAKKGFEGVLTKTSIDDLGRFELHDICIGTSVGDYTHYVNRPKSSNDLHGVGGFILACVELDEMINNE